MTYWEAVLLAIVQGIFMFFPVSSTAHMVLVEHWLGASGSAMAGPETPEMILFKLVVHVGTLVSIAVVFRQSLLRFLRDLDGDVRSVLGRTQRLGDALQLRLALLGLVSVFITGVIGLAFKRPFETAFAHPLAVAATLTVTGVLLYFTDTVGRRPRGLRELTLWVAVVIGLAQALALIPGFSRSGLTIALALFVGLKRRWAAEYSFFIAIPTILAATGVQSLQVLRDVRFDGLELSLGFGHLAVAFAVSAVVGVGALYLVLTLLYRARFRYFAYYVWLLAAVVAIWSIFGELESMD